MSNKKACECDALLSLGELRNRFAVASGVSDVVLVEVMAGAGVSPVGAMAGCVVFAESQVVEHETAIRAACGRAALGVLLDAQVLEAIARTIAAEFGPVLVRRVETLLSASLDDLDGRLDRLLEQGQGLFRQQGELGQRLREVERSTAAIVSDVRAADAALKKDVRIAIDGVQADSRKVLEAVLEELQAVRLSLNQLAKAAR